MSKNYMTLFLGGMERGLKFNFGTLRFLGEITDSDPLKFAGSGNPSDQFKFVKSIVHAALLSNYLSLKKQPDFTDAEVTDWVSDLNMEDATKVTQAFTLAFSAEAPGTADTQQ